MTTRGVDRERRFVNFSFWITASQKSMVATRTARFDPSVLLHRPTKKWRTLAFMVRCTS